MYSFLDLFSTYCVVCLYVYHIILFKCVDVHAALPEMTPSKVLTLARCIASNPDESDLMKIAKQLQFYKEASNGMFCELAIMVYSLNVHVGYNWGAQRNG